MDALTGLPIFQDAQVLWITFAAGVLFGILTGKLIPKSWHDGVVRLLEVRNAEQREETENWRTSSENKDAVIAKLTEGLQRLADAQETTERVVQSLPNPEGGEDP